jgi:hypothetical protein
MTPEEIHEAIKNYTPSKDRKYRERCFICGKEVTEIDRIRGKCSCQILTAEDLNKRVTI